MIGLLGGAVAIREGSADDCDLAYRLIQDAFDRVGPIDPPLGALRETPKTLAAKVAGGETLLLADLGGEPAGCLFCATQGGALYVGRLAVHPRAQRRGVARTMIETAGALARARGCATLRLNARVAMPGNVALFERMGFRIVGDGRHPGHATPTFRILELPLP